MSAIRDKLEGLFRKRRLAYLKVFNKENVFTQDVLMDLASFCRADQSTFHPDPRAHAVLEGRREVWLRIQSYLKYNSDELYKLYGPKGDNKL